MSRNVCFTANCVYFHKMLQFNATLLTDCSFIFQITSHPWIIHDFPVSKWVMNYRYWIILYRNMTADRRNWRPREIVHCWIMAKKKEFLRQQCSGPSLDFSWFAMWFNNWLQPCCPRRGGSISKHIKVWKEQKYDHDCQQCWIPRLTVLTVASRYILCWARLSIGRACRPVRIPSP